MIFSDFNCVIDVMTFDLTILTQKKSDDGVIVDVDNGVDDVVDARGRLRILFQMREQESCPKISRCCDGVNDNAVDVDVDVNVAGDDGVDVDVDDVVDA